MENLYKKIISFPKIIILFFLLILTFSLYQSKNFRLDASADTLLVENDPDLNYLREINKRYTSEEFFILTYSPNKNIDEIVVKDLEELIKRINSFNWVSKTISIINAPLFQSTNEPLADRIKNLKYITNKDVKLDIALKELVNSPIYRDLIISKDSKTLGIVVYLKDNKLYLDATNEKSELLKNKKNNKEKIKIVEQKIEILKKEQSNNIRFYNSTIKNLIKEFSSKAEIRLSGIPMIADDMITFIQSDIVIFGTGVFLFIVFTLWLIFKNLKWVLFSLINCFVSILIMIGLLGFLNWKVTVISSNFIALMLILTMSLNIHYLVRYMQIKNDDDHNQNENVLSDVFQASKTIFSPSLYAVLTTVCAFLSLIFCDIRPVIDFGWMMTIGLLVSFLNTFLLVPSMILIFNPPIPQSIKEKDSAIANYLQKLSVQSFIVYGVSVILVIISFYGISKLKVENSFVNYFSKKTEIYKGMKKIDETLGGTTPLEITLKLKKTDNIKSENDDFLGTKSESKDDKSKYWFTVPKIEKIVAVHKYLESLPEIGKVLSFYSILQVAEGLNDNKKLGSLEMLIVYNKLPTDIKNQIINPYISIENDEARLSARILDSKEDLRRNELIKKINLDLKNKFNLNENEFKLAGVLIIFNNLLQSLFNSQIKTLGFVMIGIFLMFLVLFRSLKLSIIGTVPNFIAAFFVLGVIGVANIPLDMMTITIASITIGIAVDNSIHYIYRFQDEIKKKQLSEIDVTKICHQSVGKSILSSSITITFGFSILVLSNFFPTIYFGLFTGLAMITAMFLVLTLLPNLLIKFYKA